MPTAAKPTLTPGCVYRTRDFAPWAKNAPRLANRLVEEGSLVQMAHGLFACPEQGKFGNVPPRDEEVMRAFLGTSEFVFTGSEQWNALGLGSTAVFAKTVVYNRKRSGEFKLGGRTYWLRRVQFPDDPTPEWFGVDLMEHASQVGMSPDDVASSLREATLAGRLDGPKLHNMAQTYGSKSTQAQLTAVAQ